MLALDTDWDGRGRLFWISGNVFTTMIHVVSTGLLQSWKGGRG